MRTSTILAGLAATVPAFAQRPANTTICSYYTTALLKENTGANQQTLLTLLVNTAVIGNYTKPNVGVSVAGILAKGTYNGTEVNLLPYFDGGFASSNRGGSSGVAVNFLDDGGAAPLMMNMPSNGNSSNQYMLLTHLYQYFGALLGCDAVGFPAYQGDASQAGVHRFMDLSPYEVGYFIEQVGMAAASFGVATADIKVVATALNKLFGYKCSPPTTVIPAQGAQLQSICLDESCPVAPNATCAAYPAESMPAIANATLVGTNSTSANGSAMGTATMPATASSTFTGSAAKIGAEIGAGLLALFAFVL
ncbi:hypothetical protein MBLNU459_g6455t1 [Dothideomycetes sp. NU459]